MKKFIITAAAMLTLVTSYSYAQYTNHFTKTVETTEISATASQDKPFTVSQLNEDPRINNK
ncbi:hypothetical protein [Zophobihabitans entericus]|uniref:Uncharacterized protein n=1 Tax=Zophobihabitans entericus TaxID=1635327 RepID=A0A6G9ICQ5_9GAMM|nr:hypothetical protein [Zophobihabitans entericus]QIQ22016.1 hypothetical protein IPMB12_10160 [Zophobihabitans entericus]